MPTWCDSAASGQWWVTRFEACGHDYEIRYTAYLDGLPVGQAIFHLDQEMTLSATSLAWSEDSFLTTVSTEGELAGLVVAVTSSCGANCTSNEPTWGGIVGGEGTTIEGHPTYNPSVGTGQKATFNTSYTYTFTQAAAIPITSAESSGPNEIRCDDMVGKFPGCVNTGYPGIVTMSLSDPLVGQSAAGILFAQTSLPNGRWGTSDKLLHRLADPDLAEGNRELVCDSTFVPDPVDQPGDSCDEYAFAASEESGGWRGLTGKDCAEIYPYEDGGQWYVSKLRFTGDEVCQVAHVVSSINSNAGLAYGRAVTNQRILDKEAFGVQVTS
jgi:hypothetical protein